MTADRSWSRRGLTSPAPWAVSVARVDLDQEVRFMRGTRVADPSGTWTTTPPSTYLSSAAHVEDSEAGSVDRMDSTTGAVYRHTLRSFLVIIPVPSDPGRYPKKDDVVVWTDPAGRHFRLGVRAVRLPGGLLDHFEVETEGYE